LGRPGSKVRAAVRVFRGQHPWRSVLTSLPR
jgi:hypothetical protein